jgi:uncharacterized RDD family membrane protein YckC
MVYATFGRRLKASIIDSVVLLVILLAVPLTSSLFVNDSFRGLAVLMYGPLFILEPLLVSFWGQTIGQYVLGMKVVREHTLSKCPLHLSFVRFYAKAILGLWSMIYMAFSTKHKAIHDYLAQTVVVLSPARLAKNPSFAQVGEPEQTEETQYVYPSRLRRFAIFVVWWFAVIISFDLVAEGILSIFVGSPEATKLWKSVDKLVSIFDSVLLVVIASLAAKGLLPGARRTLKLAGLANDS